MLLLMQALEILAKNQQVEYDFGVYTLPMPADVPITILSDGPSLLKAAVSLEVPLNAGAAGDSSQQYFIFLYCS